MKWFLRIGGTVLAMLFIAFLILRVPDTDPEAMRTKYGEAPSQFVEIGDGVTVHLRDEGPRNATPIILLHGSAADLHTWQPWVDRLSENYRIIRFDQVGHGLTGPDPEHDYSIENFVADIDEVADALELDTFVLGGNSMGGGHSLAYALEHPERVDGLILVDAGGADIPRESKGNIGFTIARTPVINRVMRHITPRSLVASSLRQSVSNQNVASEEAIDRYWELLRFPGNRAATIVRFSQGWKAFTQAQIASVSIDTLILWGEEDRLISVEGGRWFDQYLPNSELLVYEGIGHLPQEEAPDLTAADTQTWLDQLTNPSD